MSSQRQISELYRLINNLIQFAKITKQVGDRFECLTANGLETKPLPLMPDRAGDDRTSWMPSIGEQVLIFAPGGITENAVIGKSLWCDDYPAPSTDPDIHQVTYKDGAVIKYNKKTHELTATLPEDGIFKVIAPGGSFIVGSLDVEGPIRSTSDITDKTRSMAEDRAIYNLHANSNHKPPAPNQ